MTGHTHDNGHDHGHHHAPASFGAAFAIGIALNTGFVAIEAIYGLLAHSMALVADAGHNFGDVLGLAMAWAAAILGRRAPSATYTYGLRRGTILAALANAVLLLVTVGAIAVEAIRRLVEPAPVASVTIMAVAAIGILVNGITAWLFASGRKGDLNLRAAFTHMAADALVSLGVVAAGAVILWTGWFPLDPLASLVIAGIILVGTWSLLRDSLALSLDSVPAGIEPAAVRAFLEAQPGVLHIHDLHVWPMSTTETALTCHLVMPGGHPGDHALAGLADALHHRFDIDHTTVQVETDVSVACRLAPAHVV